MVIKAKQYKLLVTGASGFIGKEVVKYLATKEYKVRAFVRKGSVKSYNTNIEIFRGDILDRKSLDRALENVDAVIHLAASKNDEKNSFRTNVVGARNLITACKDAKVKRILNISTASTTLHTLGLYGSTKKAADNIFMTSELDVTTLKPSIVYGNFKDGVFGTLAKAVKKPIMPIFGNGNSLFRPIHIEDLAILIDKCLNSKITIGKEYDVGGPNLISFKNIALKIRTIRTGNKKIRFIYLPSKVGLLSAKLFSSFKKPIITESNILGLIQTASLGTEIYRDVGFIPRAFDIGLHDIETKEKYFGEPEIMYNYLFSSTGKRYVVDEIETRDYWRALKSNGVENKGFSTLIYEKPFLIGPLDAVSKMLYPSSTLQKKILITSALIETNKQSAEWMLPSNKNLNILIGSSIWYGVRALIKAALGLGLFIVTKEFFNRNVQ